MSDIDYAAVAISATELGFDPAALKAKYDAERAKRLRSDGIGQYVEMKDTLAHYLDDPYIDAPIKRDPLTDEVDVVVIGGGFGGLLTGARLREAGVNNIRIIEKGGDFGGTWYWNRYPGAACDVESYIYLPLLEETGFMPVEKYTKAPEILEYCKLIARTFDLYRDVCFQTEVTAMHWDEEASRWIVSTNRGDAIRARFVSMANGPLHKPKLPGIPGVESFKGHSFHTSRWDYDYSGGSPAGGLTGLAGKRIGIIGTGATGVQCIPHIGEAAGHLYVFQRTPSSIDVRNNRPTDPEWAGELEPGWHQHRMDNFNTLVSGGHQDVDLVSDGWTDIIRNLGVIAQKRAALEANQAALSPAELVQLADFQKMEQIRARVDSVVSDKATAEALKSYYNQFCKRPCFHDDYLATFNRPNVTLVDTAGKGVDRITEKGIIVGDTEYELDCLIYATGFEVGTAYTRRTGYEIYGRGGQSLTEKWADGAKTFHGMHINGFPNCFIMSQIQSAFTVNFPHMLNEQSRHIAYIVAHALTRNIIEVDASPDAEAQWTSRILTAGFNRAKFLADCTPGLFNGEGQISELAASYAPFGFNSMPFFEILSDWREAGQLAGLDLRE